MLSALKGKTIDSWGVLESAVDKQLSSQLGQNVARKVRLEVEVPGGKKYTIIPDNLENADGVFTIHESKFSSVNNLLDATANKIRQTFTKNQKPAFDAITDGTAKVRLLNSQGGRDLLGQEFKFGQQIYVQPKINIYVNTPQNTIGHRFYEGIEP